MIWTIPPSSTRLRWLIETVEPSELYLCGQRATDDRLSGVLRSVAGMCRYALSQDGLLHLGRMAARLGVTEAVIRQCLLWLESKGLVTLAEWTPDGQTSDTVRIEAGRRRAGQRRTGPGASRAGRATGRGPGLSSVLHARQAEGIGIGMMAAQIG